MADFLNDTPGSTVQIREALKELIKENGVEVHKDIWYSFGLKFQFDQQQDIFTMAEISLVAGKSICPPDLIEWVNSDHRILWALYDVGLLPEQIRNHGQLCGLRGFQAGWRIMQGLHEPGAPK